jgi:hypothetical protein
MQQILNTPQMKWLESGVFCAVRPDGYASNNGYSNRGTVFSMHSVHICYSQDN